jgi:hypothetical protein
VKARLKSLGPWAKLVVFLLGVLGVFVTWWALLITFETAADIGQIWYYWFRTIYLGIPVLVLLNILIWPDKKGKLIWAISFIGAPIFVTLLRAIWWLVNTVSDIWSSLWN